MDNDHKILLGMINKLHEAMTAGKSKEVMSQLITELKKYTMTHFSSEETHLAHINHPHLPEQKQQHAMFSSKITEFEKEYSAGNMVLAVKIMPFLNDWLLGHIMQVDKKYADE